MSRARSVAVIFFVTYTFLECLIVRNCSGQTARGVEQANPDHFGFGGDIVKSYQIIYNYKNDKDYLNYAQSVRERIKKSLTNSHRRYYKEGDVNLLFIIRSDGKLARFDIDQERSTDDKKLIDIAASSLKGSSPFPPFPKNLPVDQLPFSIIISFKNE